jgi:hypothetical protein
MGFLDKVFGTKKPQRKPRKAAGRRYPTRSIINDPDLKTLTDFSRCYPLPEDFEYQERKPGDVVVVRKSDGAEFVFLVEEGLLGFDVPRQRKDGSWGKRTTEVFKQGGEGPHPSVGKGQFDFPLGKNIISDSDIQTFADLSRYYPLPEGYEYRKTASGEPVVYQPADNRSFSFLIEEGLMSFDEPYTREDGRTGYRTTEVFKRA